MQYLLNDIKYAILPQTFTKSSSREILQYAVGGLLYMPASNRSIANKIITHEYDFVKSLVLDLEDSLGDDLIELGMQTIKGIISDLAAALADGRITFADIPLIFIRVRESGQMTQVCKVLGDNVRYITGFNIPKFDKTNCDAYISEFKQLPSAYSLYLMPILEDKFVLYQQYRMDNLLYLYDSLKEINSSVLNIRVGGADFCNILGVRRSINDTIYDIDAIASVLADIINVFGRGYVVSGPVWEFFRNKNNPEDTKWLTGLQKEVYKDRLNGFIGKTCIHPTQLSTVQQSLIVSISDYQEAVSILGMNPNAAGVSKSISGNRMNAVKTHTHWAKKIICLAAVYGVKQEGNT